MKNVLVTGADGFIGSHLVEKLVESDYNVRALCLYNSFNNWGWLEESKYLKDIEIVSGDVRDSTYCMKITEGVDTVFHLAALIAIPYSYLAPNSYVDTNVTGTLNICQGALRNGVRKVMHTSTSEVYGSARYVPIDEAHPLQPQSPYSASKIAADAMAMSFHLSFELPLTIARPFNTYGPRQSARAVIPTIISQLAAGKREISLGDLRPTRDFNYVGDTVAGMIALARSDKTIGQTVNIGSNYEVSIGDLFDLINKLMGTSAVAVEDQQRIRPKNSEVQRLWAENKLMYDLTGFKPQVTLEEGLKRTIDWFTNPENLKRYKTNTYNV